MPTQLNFTGHKPKHTLPTTTLTAMSICPWCGRDKGKIALPSSYHEPVSDKLRLIVDYEPCSRCEQEWDGRVMCFETTYAPITPGQIPINTDFDGRDVFPTGVVVALTEEAARDMFDSDFKAGARLCLDTNTFKSAFNCTGCSEEDTSE
ncbi:hypothetical protein J6A31_08905 [bacterium]|nr:hypothetical protein [bacterium]